MSIYAWRKWSYVPNYYGTISHEVLYGAVGFVWPVGKPLKAECVVYDHYDLRKQSAPAADCTCGIYAMKKYSKLPDTRYYSGDITGIVEIWGKIIVAKYGYRAEYGQIRAVVEAPEFISHAYGIPNLASVKAAKKEYFR